jgi:molecular chaperone DnaJ
MTSDQCFYSILGIDRTASPNVVTAAYRRLAMTWHPDRHLDPTSKVQAAAKFKIIQAAYSTLSDENKRLLYDARTSSVDPYGYAYGAEENFDSTYDRMREIWRQSQPRGKDVKKKVTLTIAEALNGCRIEVVDTFSEKCTACEGYGEIEANCPKCSGRGYGRNYHQCTYCDGLGTHVYDCTTCIGEGKVYRERALRVNTPPGCIDGAVIVGEGRGRESKYGGYNGDLIIRGGPGNSDNRISGGFASQSRPDG